MHKNIPEIFKQSSFRLCAVYKLWSGFLGVHGNRIEKKFLKDGTLIGGKKKPLLQVSVKQEVIEQNTLHHGLSILTLCSTTTTEEGIFQHAHLGPMSQKIISSDNIAAIAVILLFWLTVTDYFEKNHHGSDITIIVVVVINTLKFI